MPPREKRDSLRFMQKTASHLLTFLLTLFVGLATLLPNAQALEKVKLALNWKPEPQFGGFYAAQFSGLDAKNKIQLEVMAGGAGTPVVQMVAAGQVDFGIASADEVVIARSRGADVVAVFAAYQTNPQAIMTHEERGYKSLSDVYGAEGTLAIQKGLPYALFLENKFRAQKKTLKAKIVPYLGGIQNFMVDPNYSQQCFATSEPLAAKRLKKNVKTFLIADEGYNPYTTVLIVRGDVLRKNEVLVRSVVSSVRAGWREYLDKPDAANKKMGELNKSMDAQTFTASALAQKPLVETQETASSGLGSMTTARWTQLIQQLVELKLVKKPADVASHFRAL